MSDNIADNTSQNKQNRKLRIFVVPHSHMDPGWLQTFQSYMKNTNKTIDLAVEYLRRYPDMRFQLMTTSFLEQWWSTSDTTQRELLKKLVHKKKFDLVTGAWTMTDEASPYFWASIDNLIEGHRFVYNTFGVIPTVSWSNDPFGYGPTMPYLLHKAGINKLVINRVNPFTKDFLRDGHNMEFLWRQAWDANGVFDSRTHLLPYANYDIDSSCGPDKTICCQYDFMKVRRRQCPMSGTKSTDSKFITSQNVAEKAKQILGQLRLSARNYKHNSILFMLGDDFRYKDASDWNDQYDNFETLMEYINSEAGREHDAEMKFSTLTEYFKSLPSDLWRHRAIKVTGDFFPYTDNRREFWSGFYTSRAFHKRLDRIVQSHLRAADIFSSLALENDKLSSTVREALANDIFEMLTKARRDHLALFQHHDAITGTSKPNVMADYALRLNNALSSVESVLAMSTVIMTSKAESLTNDDITNRSMELEHPDKPYDYKNPEATMSICVRGERVISIMNPLPSYREEVIRLRVNNAYVQVTHSDGTAIEAQVQPAIDYNTKIEDGIFEVVFILRQRPLSISVVYVTAVGNKVPSTIFVHWECNSLAQQQGPIAMKKLDPATNISVDNKAISATFDSKTGLIQQINNSGTVMKCAVNFASYHSSGGGAYIFKSGGKATNLFKIYSAMPSPADIHLIQGPVLSEVHTLFAGIWHRATIVNWVETDKSIGDVIQLRNIIITRPLGNLELVLQIESDIESQTTFWTDSMGFQIFQRHYQESKPAEHNYYPISTSIYVEDNNHRMTLLTAQPHGGMMYKPGGIEVMLDRTLDRDDHRGLGEGVKDNVPVTSDFKLIFQRENTLSSDVHAQSLSGYHSPSTIGEMRNLLNPPVILIYSSTPTRESLSNYIPPITPLPVTYDLLSLRSIDSGLGPLLMIIHRRGSTCNVCQVSKKTCSMFANPSMTTIPLLLRLLRTEAANETSLTGIYDQASVSMDPFVLREIEPMDMVTYKLIRRKYASSMV